MSTQAQVRAAWESKIWQHPDILTITPKIFAAEIKVDSQKEAASLRHENKVNCFSYVVRRYPSYQVGRVQMLAFQVDIRYLIWADTEKKNYNKALDAIELVETLVRTELGYTWGGTVDHYTLQEGPAVMELIAIGGEPVHQVTYSFEGIKKIVI